MAKLKAPVQHVGDAGPQKVAEYLKPGVARPCEAYGCPLAGTYSSHTREGGSWWCYIHAELSAMDLQDATAIINSHKELIERIRSLYRMQLKQLKPYQQEYQDVDKQILTLRHQLQRAVTDGLNARQL